MLIKSNSISILIKNSKQNKFEFHSRFFLFLLETFGSLEHVTCSSRWAKRIIKKNVILQITSPSLLSTVNTRHIELFSNANNKIRSFSKLEVMCQQIPRKTFHGCRFIISPANELTYGTLLTMLL